MVQTAGRQTRTTLSELKTLSNSPSKGLGSTIESDLQRNCIHLRKHKAPPLNGTTNHQRPMGHVTVGSYELGIHTNGGLPNVFIGGQNQKENFFKNHPIEYVFTQLRKKFPHTAETNVIFGAETLPDSTKNSILHVAPRDPAAEAFAATSRKTDHTRRSVTPKISKILENKVVTSRFC